MGTSKDEKNDKQVFVLILTIELVLALIGLIIGYPNGIYGVIAGYIFGFLLPIFLYKKFNAKKVNFPHLVERVSLIIIIAFGEAIVNLANYFNNKTPLFMLYYCLVHFVSCLQVM